MTRQIIPSNTTIKNIPVIDVENLVEWLEKQIEENQQLNFEYLLAHTDDGVIWGKVKNNKLLLSSNVDSQISPLLIVETLQQVRLFSPKAELLVWRDGDNQLNARLISNLIDGEKPDFTEAIDEEQILWGTDIEKPKNKNSLENEFTLMKEGSQGLRHIVPIKIEGKFDEQFRPLRLLVRHYISEDTNGFNRIVASRLLRLEVKK
ncbi:MAG: CRISPR-associated protein Csx19 [Blastocatellia bacterium]